MCTKGQNLLKRQHESDENCSSTTVNGIEDESSGECPRKRPFSFTENWEKERGESLLNVTQIDNYPNGFNSSTLNSLQLLGNHEGESFNFGEEVDETNLTSLISNHYCSNGFSTYGNLPNSSTMGEDFERPFSALENELAMAGIEIDGYGSNDSGETLSYSQSNESGSGLGSTSPKSPSTENPEILGGINDSKEAFKKLIPSLRKVDAKNCADILIDALRSCSHQMSLDDFFNLLFNCDSPENLVSVPVDGLKVDNSNSTMNLEALKFCYLVLEAFRSPEKIPTFLPPGVMKKPRFTSVKLQEFLGVFLAVKIILDSVEPIEDLTSKNTSLMKITMYKAYYIICNQLVQKYQTSTYSSRLYRDIVLSQGRMDKLMKQIFPNLISKRLGKKGESRFHYLGMGWKGSIISEEILSMTELGLPELERNFRIKHIQWEKTKKTTKKKIIKDEIIKPVPQIVTLDSKQTLHPLIIKKPPNTFVNLTCNLPASKCSLRIWNIVPGLRPQQSQWSKDIIKRSIEKLKGYNVDIQKLVDEFNTGNLGSETEINFFNQGIQILLHLVNLFASKDAYLNFYLTFLLLVLPIALSTKEELSDEVRLHFRDSFTDFVEKLEKEFTDISVEDKVHFRKFLIILRKLLSLMRMFRTGVKTALTKRITNEMIRDFNSLADTQNYSLIGKSKVNQIILRSVLTAMNALDFHPGEPNSERSPDSDVSTVIEITKALITLCKKVADSTSQISSNMSDEDSSLELYELPSNIFIESKKIYHEIFVCDPALKKLPAPMIRYIFFQITNEMQNLSFNEYGKRGNALSQETFKTWWIFSMIVQEYFAIFSEIAALECRLSETKAEVEISSG